MNMRMHARAHTHTHTHTHAHILMSVLVFKFRTSGAEERVNTRGKNEKNWKKNRWGRRAGTEIQPTTR
jgi:hypothetical protein